MTPEASYTVHCITDLFVLISDDDREGCRSVTNDADRVVTSLHESVASLHHRRVFYLDSLGQIDELRHDGGRFHSFGPCSDSQREMLAGFLPKSAAKEAS